MSTLEDHRKYLDDPPRLAAFQSALQAVVRAGDVVLDLGSGSGILGFLACRAGASRVYAVDHSPAIQLGRELARANGFADRITFIYATSTAVTLPELADVLVFDQLGPMGFQAGSLEYGTDARRRLLTPEARSIPASFEIHLAAVGGAAVSARINFWTSRPLDIDLSPVHGLAANTLYTAPPDGLDLLTPSARLVQSEVAGLAVAPLSGDVDLEVTSPGMLDGLCGWFVAQLAPGIEMTNGPGASGRIDRQVALLPIVPALKVTVGDRIRVRARILPIEEQVAWEVNVTAADGSPKGHARHSTFLGTLILDEQRRSSGSNAFASS